MGKLLLKTVTFSAATILVLIMSSMRKASRNDVTDADQRRLRLADYDRRRSAQGVRIKAQEPHSPLSRQPPEVR